MILLMSNVYVHTVLIPIKYHQYPRRIFEDLIEKFNSCYDQIKPKKLKNDLNKIIEKLGKKIDAHYDKILDNNENDDNELLYDHDIPITLSSKLADALHSLQSSLATL